MNDSASATASIGAEFLALLVFAPQPSGVPRCAGRGELPCRTAELARRLRVTRRAPRRRPEPVHAGDARCGGPLTDLGSTRPHEGSHATVGAGSWRHSRDRLRRTGWPKTSEKKESCYSDRIPHSGLVPRRLPSDAAPMPIMRHLPAGFVVATLLLAACGFAAATLLPSVGHSSRDNCTTVLQPCQHHGKGNASQLTSTTTPVQTTTTVPATATAPAATTTVSATTAPATTTAVPATTAPATTTAVSATTAPATTTAVSATTAPATTTAVPATTTAAPAAISTNTTPVVFDGGFETGTYKPWGTPQSSNWGNPVNNAGVHFGPFNVVTNRVGQGRYAGEFDLPAWSGGKTRSQVITPRPIGVGTDDYYTLMFYIPQGWTPGTSSFWGVQIAEMDFEGLGGNGGPVSLQLHSDHLTLNLASGVTTTTAPYSQYRSNADSPGTPNVPALYAVPRGSLRQGAWNELIVHVHWATHSTGAIDAWDRVLGQSTWTKTVSLSGYPTLQTNANGSLPARTNDVIQAYRGASTAPVSVWLDGFSRSQSFATAAAYLP